MGEFLITETPSEAFEGLSMLLYYDGRWWDE
jgi:hypothetical protein